ncbi:hypothetical protein [Desulfonatronum thioautotrophicum]|uniref:hypothetical protein n=1 Tax=Desulfonatronum thioautotrophicum TaxID=617001 RepID=UPI0005EAFCA3|nr:hypothetical protein [Desulfonatronum thioautotrophicum]
MKNKLRQVMEEHWEQGCVSPRTVLAEQGRVFSLRPAKGEYAVFLQPEKCPEWPKEGKKCDGVILYAHQDDPEFMIVLVELKGGHVGHALDQLESTCRDLCAKGTTLEFKHQIWKTSLGTEGFGHSRRVFGIILGKGISLRQDRIKKLNNTLGLRVRPLTGNFQGKSIR